MENLRRRVAVDTKQHDIYQRLLGSLTATTQMYREGDFAAVTREFVLAADFVNSYIAESAPWILAKDSTKRSALHSVCTFAISAFRLLTMMLKPIVPFAVEKAERFLGNATR